MEDTLASRLVTAPSSTAAARRVRALARAHVWCYRASGGTVPGRLSGLDVLLLTTLEPRTGTSQTHPVGFVWDRGRFVTPAARGKGPGVPPWYPARCRAACDGAAGQGVDPGERPGAVLR
jgi:hypothetical protein